MKIDRTPNLVPWFRVQDVAEDWGWNPSDVIAAATAGHFSLVKRTLIDGAEVWTVTAEERAKFEAEHLKAKRPQEHPVKVRTAQWWVGAMLHLWVGNAPDDAAMLDQPYTLRDFMANDFAAQGVSMLRTDETDAEFLAEAVRVFRESGCIKRRKPERLPKSDSPAMPSTAIAANDNPAPEKQAAAD